MISNTTCSFKQFFIHLDKFLNQFIMKPIYFKSNFISALLLISLCCNAQLNLPFNVRDKYVAQNYQLSQPTIEAYNKIIVQIESEWNNLKDTKISVSARKTAEEKLGLSLSSKVKAIFSDSQYSKWHTNHRGNLKVRFYKEDLGITSEQFAEFRKISNTYSNSKKNIRKQDLSAVEQSERRKEAFNQYVNSIHNLFPEKLADYLIYENQVLNLATNLSSHYTIISENKAIKYALLKMEYDKNKKALLSQQLKPKLMKEKKEDLDNKYESSLRSFLTGEEYIACTKKRDKLTDQRYMHTYKMTASQLAKFKELKKKLAMKQLQIKQTKIEKTAKLAKLQECESEFEIELKKILTAQQFEKWKKDEVKKQSKKL